MKTSDVQGPGVDVWLLQRLLSWGIETLTDVQQRALAAGAAAGRSLVVSAPTSSGKTLVGEIAVLCALIRSTSISLLASGKVPPSLWARLD
jgi:helicase